MLYFSDFHRFCYSNIIFFINTNKKDVKFTNKVNKNLREIKNYENK